MALRKPKIKMAIYLPEEMVGEIVRLARKLDRTQSQLVEFAWRLARERLMKNGE